MRSALTFLAGAAVLISLAAPAAAQTAGDRDDARCILVLGAVAKDPNQAEAAAKGSFFYLGRLDAHGMGAKLGPLMIAEGKAIQNSAQAQMELKRCATELNQRGQMLQTGFKQVQAAAQQARPAATPAPAQPPPKK